MFMANSDLEDNNCTEAVKRRLAAALRVKD